MSADALSSLPPTDPTSLDPVVSRVIHPVGDWERLATPGRKDLIAAGLGLTVLDKEVVKEVVVIFDADSDVADPEEHEPKFEFNPTEGLSLDKFPDGSDLTTKNREYARGFVDALATGKATTYIKGTEGERAVESVIKDDEGNVTHLVVSRMVGTEVTGKKKQTSTLPVTELEESIARASDKTRFVIEPRTSRVKTRSNSKPVMTTPITLDALSPTSKPVDVEAEMTEAEKTRAAVERNAGVLNGIKATEGDGFVRVVSAETREHLAPPHRAPIEKAQIELKRLGIVTKMAKLPQDVVDIAGTGASRPFHKTAAEPKTRTMDELFDKYKFYLSLGSKTGDVAKLDTQQSFLVDLVKTATDRGIDIAWKTMDHDYDQPCIYTTNPAELSQLLAEMYAKPDYPMSMWNDSDRMFQQEVGGVSSKHIGMVQEPFNGFRAESHSSRMHGLASRLVETGEITPEAFREAAQQGGLRPEAPWLLSDEARTEYYTRIEARKVSARAARERSRT